MVRAAAPGAVLNPPARVNRCLNGNGDALLHFPEGVVTASMAPCVSAFAELTSRGRECGR
jgi:hypothetical protein